MFTHFRETPIINVRHSKLFPLGSFVQQWKLSPRVIMLQRKPISDAIMRWWSHFQSEFCATVSHLSVIMWNSKPIKTVILWHSKPVPDVIVQHC